MFASELKGNANAGCGDKMQYQDAVAKKKSSEILKKEKGRKL